MVQAALKTPYPSPMTVDQFLAWTDDTDTRYELVAGEVVAMTPPSPAHSLIAGNLSREIGTRLQSPCRVFMEAGVRLNGRDDTFYQADLAISCTPLRPGDNNVREPVVIIEVLSPSTASHDRGAKLPDYREVLSVREIVLVSSDMIKAEAWHRKAEEWAVNDLKDQDAILRLDSVNVEVSLATIYEGVAFEPMEKEAGTADR